MYGKNAITREQETKFPSFSDHESARSFFKEKYGAAFQLVNSELIGDRKCYFYHLILAQNNYQELQEQLSKGEAVMGMELIFSYQSVEIFEDGAVHVVY